MFKEVTASEGSSQAVALFGMQVLLKEATSHQLATCDLKALIVFILPATKGEAEIMFYVCVCVFSVVTSSETLDR